LNLFLPEADIVISTPNPEFLSEFLPPGRKQLKVIKDDSDQRGAILNSWRLGGFDWYTWINDDDFALAGIKHAVNLAESINYTAIPVVIYGNLSIMSERGVRRVRTPRFLNTWLLASGSDYVPGLLTLINNASLKVLLENEHQTRKLRNSFDYHWWLQLAKSKAKFQHTNSSHGVWRDHPNARTQTEIPLSKMETNYLQLSYLPFALRIPIVRTINALFAKTAAKLLSIQKRR
jgi:hypothetical protein